MDLSTLFNPHVISGVNIIIAFMLCTSLTTLFQYLFYEGHNFSSNKNKDQQMLLEYSFMKDATPDQLEAFWLSRKGKLTKKQRRYLSRLRNNEITSLSS